MKRLRHWCWIVFGDGPPSRAKLSDCITTVGYGLAWAAHRLHAEWLSIALWRWAFLRNYCFPTEQPVPLWLDRLVEWLSPRRQ